MTQSGSSVLRIGSRGSPLALAQARELRERLNAAHGFGEDRLVVEVIRTSGDLIQDRPLSQAGGKGLFTKEIEEALLAGRIDMAVHSSKDMPTALPAGLTIAACLEREDPRDAFISRQVKSFADLKDGATLGTSSLRRQAMAKRLRADLRIVPLRGNVETRLRKLEDGVADATLLALAGLKRLGLVDKATAILDTDIFLPAVGQGAIAIEIRKKDELARGLLAKINHAATMTALRAERAFLAVLDGSCRTPIGGHATIVGGHLYFRGMIITPDGSRSFETSRKGNVSDAAELGADAGRELKSLGGSDFFAPV